MQLNYNVNMKYASIDKIINDFFHKVNSVSIIKFSFLCVANLDRPVAENRQQQLTLKTNYLYSGVFCTNI